MLKGVEKLFIAFLEFFMQKRYSKNAVTSGC